MDKIAYYFDYSFNVQTELLGFKKPLNTYLDPDYSGSSKFNIYVLELGDNILGYCTVDWEKTYRAEALGPFMGTSPAYIAMHSNMAKFGTNVEESIKSTASHEFFHAIQFAYNLFSESWWMETTAMWMEDMVFDKMGQSTYPGYIRSWVNRIGTSLDLDEADPSGGIHKYGNVIWALFLTEMYDEEPDTYEAFILGKHEKSNIIRQSLVREIWEEIASNPFYVWYHIENALAKRNIQPPPMQWSSFVSAFQEFAEWNYFTSIRDDGKHYKDGYYFPQIPIYLNGHTYEGDFPRIIEKDNFEANPQHLATMYYSLKADKDYGDFEINFDGDSYHQWGISAILVKQDSSTEIKRFILHPETQDGRIRFEGFGDTYREAVLAVSNILPSDVAWRIDIGSQVEDEGLFNLYAGPVRNISVNSAALRADTDGGIELKWVLADPAQNSLLSGFRIYRKDGGIVTAGDIDGRTLDADAVFKEVSASDTEYEYDDRSGTVSHQFFYAIVPVDRYNITAHTYYLNDTYAIPVDITAPTCGFEKIDTGINSPTVYYFRLLPHELLSDTPSASATFLSDSRTVPMSIYSESGVYYGILSIDSVYQGDTLFFSFYGRDRNGNIGTSVTAGKYYTLREFINTLAPVTITNTDGSFAELPAGALSGEAKVVIRPVNEQNDTTISDSLKYFASYSTYVPLISGSYSPFRQFCASDRNGTCIDKLAKPARIGIAYPDADNDGIMDGTSYKAENLKIMRLKGITWEPLSVGTTVDFGNRVAYAYADDMSTYALFVRVSSVPPTNKIIAFPVPYNPSIEPYITFKIESYSERLSLVIYNLAGDRIYGGEYTGVPACLIKWDGKTSGGDDTASGFYLAVISDKEGNVYKGKIFLIR